MTTDVLWFDISVGPCAYHVWLSNPETCPALEGGANEGAFESADSAIYVNRHLPRDRWAEVAMHELLHCVIASSGLDNALKLNAKSEELLVSIMSPPLTAALQSIGAYRLPKLPKLPRVKRSKK